MSSSRQGRSTTHAVGQRGLRLGLGLAVRHLPTLATDIGGWAPRVPRSSHTDIGLRSCGRTRRHRAGAPVTTADAGWPCHGSSSALDRAEVAHPGAAVVVGVGVEHLGPRAGGRQADPVVVVRHRREVRHADQRRTRRSPRRTKRRRCSSSRRRRSSGSPAVVVERPQRRGVPVDPVEVARPAAARRGGRRSEQPPVELALSAHSDSWPNSQPMKSSCLPGCAHM